jgi:hypothetical protein
MPKPTVIPEKGKDYMLWCGDGEFDEVKAKAIRHFKKRHKHKPKSFFAWKPKTHYLVGPVEKGENQ